MSRKKYQIIIEYETGNSFGSSDEEDSVELTWNNLDIAKENLCRIREHYKWYKSKNRNTCLSKVEVISKPKWLPKQWKYDHCLLLKTDDGNDCQISAFWCGYFERLYGASIKLIDNDTSFKI